MNARNNSYWNPGISVLKNLVHSLSSRLGRVSEFRARSVPTGKSTIIIKGSEQSCPRLVSVEMLDLSAGHGNELSEVLVRRDRVICCHIEGLSSPRYVVTRGPI